MSGNDGTSTQIGNQIETPSVVDPYSQHVHAYRGGPSDLDIAISSAIINYANCMKLNRKNSVNNKKKEVKKSAINRRSNWTYLR